MLVEIDGRQIPIPMNDLLQMMGGDVGALQALLHEGDAESSDDEEIGERFTDSDSDDDSTHVVDDAEAEAAVVAQVPAPTEQDEAAPLEDGLPYVEDSVDGGL